MHLNAPRRAALALLSVAAVVSLTQTVLADGPRVAVLILPEPGTDAALADNLTEIAIARIAERQGGQMTGTVELRRRLEMEGSRPALGCLNELPCLGRVAVALGVESVVGGSVRALGGDVFMVNLTLTDVASGQVKGRFFRQVPGGLPALIAAVQAGADDLFRPPAETARLRVESDPPRARVSIDELFVGTTPLLSERLLPGPHLLRVELEDRRPWRQQLELAPGAEVQVKLGPNELPVLRRWPKVAVVTGLALSAALLGGGAVLGALSQEPAESDLRVTVQRDLAERRSQARWANALLGGGAALGIASLGTLYGFRADIFAD